jgi:hypothetical protein
MFRGGFYNLLDSSFEMSICITFSIGDSFVFEEIFFFLQMLKKYKYS